MIGITKVSKRVEVYVTDDGKEFNTEREAKQHIKRDEARKKINPLYLGSPESISALNKIMGYSPILMGYKYDFFKCNSLDDILLLEEVYSYRFPIHKMKDSFPQVIIYEHRNKQLFPLSDVLDRKQQLDEEWEKLAQEMRILKIL